MHHWHQSKILKDKESSEDFLIHNFIRCKERPPIGVFGLLLIVNEKSFDEIFC